MTRSSLSWSTPLAWRWAGPHHRFALDFGDGPPPVLGYEGHASHEVLLRLGRPRFHRALDGDFHRAWLCSHHTAEREVVRNSEEEFVHFALDFDTETYASESLDMEMTYALAGNDR